MNKDIGSRGVYLSTIEVYDVISDGDKNGDTVGGGGARSSMNYGGRDWSS
jgi:hypothetical protein